MDKLPYLRRFDAPGQFTSVSSTTPWICFKYYMRRHIDKQLLTLFFLFPQSTLCSALCPWSLTLTNHTPGSFGGWLPFWVCPMPEKEDGKRERQEYFFFLPSTLQCSISGHYQQPPWLRLCQAVFLPGHHLSPGYITLFPPFSTLASSGSSSPLLPNSGCITFLVWSP